MHTFLFRPWLWMAEGKFRDDSGHEFRATGEVQIAHGDVEWKNNGRMTIHKPDEAVPFENYYDIRPFESGSDSTRWTSVNPAIGTLVGQLAIVGDAITSIYSSDDGRFKGQEVLIQKSEYEYQAVGTFYMDGKRLSSWNVTLRKAAI